MLQSRFAIGHVTIQLEKPTQADDDPCMDCN
jgi:hypothetical protein